MVPETRTDANGVRDYYTRIVRPYDLVARSSVLVRAIRRRAVDRLALDPGDTVVDVGCGTGANAPFLREAVGPEGTVVGVDVTPAALARARAWADRNGWENVHYVQGDGTSLPVAGPVDGVLGTFVVGMFEDPGRAVGAWCDLVPDGALVAAYVAPSQRWYGPALTPALEGVVRLLTDPPARLRYDPPLVARLRAARTATRGVLTDRADRVRFSAHVGGLCHVDAGYF